MGEDWVRNFTKCHRLRVETRRGSHSRPQLQRGHRLVLLGIFYVAASRVKELGAFALRDPFCKADADSIGVGAAALQSRQEMERIAAKAAQHSAARDPAHTFEDGLRWFCAHVKAQVRERLEVEPELADVIAVCEEWEQGLEVS